MILKTHKQKGYGFPPLPHYAEGCVVYVMHNGQKTAGKVLSVKREATTGGVHIVELEIEKISLEQYIQALDEGAVNVSHGIL